MSLTLPADIQTLFGSWHALIQTPLFWWEGVVLILAATGAVLMHRALSQGLVERTGKSTGYTVRHLALKTLQRLLLPISMLMGVLAGRALLSLAPV